MSVMTRLRRRLLSLTLIECLVIIAAIVVPVALLIPETRWASSGSLRLPVRVVVFDAARASPIEGATVAVFRALPAEGAKDFPGAIPEDFLTSLEPDRRSVTGPNGTAVVEYEFRTGASDQSPTPKAHFRWEWVCVSADGYGTVVVPVRYESQPTKLLREQKEVLVLVGLIESRRDR